MNLDEISGMLSGDPKPWTPPSIDDPMPFGKYLGTTYRDAATRDRGYMRWAARQIGGLKGQLCAEALAVALGVSE